MLLNLINPNATAIVAILTAPVAVLSKNMDTIEMTAATIIGIIAEVTKKLLVPRILNEIMNVNKTLIINAMPVTIKDTKTASTLLNNSNSEFNGYIG